MGVYDNYSMRGGCHHAISAPIFEKKVNKRIHHNFVQNLGDKELFYSGD
jgi:hypothetical protein